LGFAVDGAALLGLPTLPEAVAVGLLSSALPYACEMIALRRLPPKTFGILMSLEPVSGSLAGFFFLGERLTLIQAIAIGCVITASLIASLQIQKDGPPA
ncbi:MAG: EamA family transporter, partial [Desulfovibrionaceae bacterium]|nr:EamA family transporter [Desulfovibrionaceae bacterium]